MRRVLFNLHLYTGLAAAWFVLIFGLTGSIIAFETEIDHILHWHLSYVRPQGRALSLAEITDAFSAMAWRLLPTSRTRFPCPGASCT